MKHRGFIAGLGRTALGAATAFEQFTGLRADGVGTTVYWLDAADLGVGWWAEEGAGSAPGIAHNGTWSKVQ